MKEKVLQYIFKRYENEFYDHVVETFIGQVPDEISEPALEFLADKRVLFEKFLSIQAYHIQKARLQSKKSPDFYDGALLIIKAFLAAVSKRSSMIPKVQVPIVDPEAEMKKELVGISSFSEAMKKLI